MRIHVLVSMLSVLVLSACSDLEEFERELIGNQKLAFETCTNEIEGVFKNDLDEMNLYAPTLEITNDAIVFSWDREHAEENGGPVLCSTGLNGTKLLDVRLSSAPLG